MIQITSSNIQMFMQHQLIIQVYGMIKSKEVKKKIEQDVSFVDLGTDNEATNARSKLNISNASSSL
jgi:hypothetical protein